MKARKFSFEIPWMCPSVYILICSLKIHVIDEMRNKQKIKKTTNNTNKQKTKTEEIQIKITNLQIKNQTK